MYLIINVSMYHNHVIINNLSLMGGGGGGSVNRDIINLSQTSNLFKIYVSILV